MEGLILLSRQSQLHKNQHFRFFRNERNNKIMMYSKILLITFANLCNRTNSR